MWQNLFWKLWRQFRHQQFTPLCHSLKNYRYMHLSIFRIKYRVPLILKSASHSFVIPAKLVLDQIGERKPGETISNQTIFVIPDLIRDPEKLLHIKFSTTVPKELRGLEVNSFFAVTIVSPNSLHLCAFAIAPTSCMNSNQLILILVRSRSCSSTAFISGVSLL